MRFSVRGGLLRTFSSEDTEMIDYKGMYMIMLDAADKAITALEADSLASDVQELLCNAMQQAENRYIETAPKDPDAIEE